MWLIFSDWYIFLISKLSCWSQPPMGYLHEEYERQWRKRNLRWFPHFLFDTRYHWVRGSLSACLSLTFTEERKRCKHWDRAGDRPGIDRVENSRGLWVPWAVSLWHKRAGVAIYDFNQSEPSISKVLDQWECSTLGQEGGADAVRELFLLQDWVRMSVWPPANLARDTNINI